MNAQSPTHPESAVQTVAQPTVVQLAPAAPAVPDVKPKKRRWGLILSLPLVLLAGGAAYWVTGGRYESTENANMHQSRINIASDIGGRVVAVSVADGKSVTKGTVMFQVDPEPYRLALLQADTTVQTARLQVMQLKGAYASAVAPSRRALPKWPSPMPRPLWVVTPILRLTSIPPCWRLWRPASRRSTS